MDSSIIGLIAIAAIGVVLLVAAIAWLVLTHDDYGDPGRHRDSALVMAENTRREALRVADQQAVADQAFATARRAAQADVDAARAVRLGRLVGGHRVEAPLSGDHVDGHRDVADVLADLPHPRHTA